MDGSAGKVTGRGRAFWLSLAALVLVLPASLAVRAKDSAQAWRDEYSHTPIDAAIGQPVDYAGVEWTVTRLERLFSANGASIVLAVFEASGPNLKELAEAPCQVSLGDGEGRRWTPESLAHQAVRQNNPDVAERSLCGGPTFAETEDGKPALMAATFLVPEATRDLSLSIGLLPALPNYLRVSGPPG